MRLTSKSAPGICKKLSFPLKSTQKYKIYKLLFRLVKGAIFWSPNVVDFISFVVYVLYYTSEKQNEKVYTAIQAGLVEGGFAKKKTENIRLKYRKLKTRFK